MSVLALCTKTLLHILIMNNFCGASSNSPGMVQIRIGPVRKKSGPVNSLANFRYCIPWCFTIVYLFQNTMVFYHGLPLSKHHGIQWYFIMGYNGILSWYTMVFYLGIKDRFI